MRASSHTYAVKPSQDPPTIRYPTASAARSETCGTVPHSPAASDSASSTAPPSIICAPAVSGSDPGRGSERVSTAPSDQATPPARITRHGSTATGCACGPASSQATAPNPSSTGASSRQRNGCTRNTNTSSTMVLSGSVASITEVSPEGTYCSAQKSAA